MTSDIIKYLAERGLIFIQGAPPLSEDRTFLVWTGGCNALVAHWEDGRMVPWDGEAAIPTDSIDYWMRMPHPSIWPDAPMPSSMVAERALYSAATDVIKAWIEHAAKPVELDTFKHEQPAADALWDCQKANGEIALLYAEAMEEIETLKERLAEQKPVAAEDIDVEIAIAEAVQLMPPRTTYEEKGVPILKYLKKHGYVVMHADKAKPPSSQD
jgi:hypothetical protein